MENNLAPASLNPLALLQQALTSGVDPDRLGKLMDLAERWQQAESVKAFAHALTQFQAEMPKVLKTRKADRYTYAAFEDVMALAAPLLTKYAIVVNFSNPSHDGKTMNMVCRLRVGSYSEDHPFTAPMPDLAKIANQMRLTEPQAFGQVLSYYKRYAFCAAVNIVLTGEDTDAQALITAEQIGLINDLLKACQNAGQPVNLTSFCTWLGVKSLDQLPAKKFDQAILELNRRRKGPKS